MKVDIICPLYNAEKYIINLHNSILSQENVDINSINYIITKGKDKTIELVKQLETNFEIIDSKNFSHSLTREKTAMKCEADILVFITQDIIIKRKDWLYNLVKDIINNKCVASYSRQICETNSIEKYTRESNYPKESLIKDKSMIKDLGLNTFFFSDASSAIKTSIFKRLNGYDNKHLPTNEDMYIAYKIIQNGYRIKYCADSEIIHSHEFSFRELYKRYKLTGQFFKENKYLNQYSTTHSGINLAVYILKRIIEDKNGKAMLEYIPNMTARFIGMKLGSFKN